MGRRTVRHRDMRRKRRSEKEESIKKEKLGQRGDHPTVRATGLNLSFTVHVCGGQVPDS